MLRKLAVVVGPILLVAATVLASSAVGQPVSPRPSQLIVASAPFAESAVGNLTAYERAGSQWKVVLGPMPADFGELGVGTTGDDVFRTPEGTFPLGQSFGREPNPGTRMPYFQTTDEDWWDVDPESPTYNRHVRAAEIDSRDAENLFDMGPVYDYAVLIDHNPQRIPGRSAAIFLHVADGEPTWGCVAVGRDQMRSILQWLDPAAHPHITIGVGIEGPPAPS